MLRKDYYSILGVSKNANQEAIKAAFRKKVMFLHPDKNPNDAEAEEKFREVMEAYEVLLDPVRRSKYDQGSYYYSNYSKRSTANNSGGQKQKSYSFTEAEFERRQQMAREYREKLRKQSEEEESRLPSYSDFKYIMFSIPLAIALLFFVMNFSQSPNEHQLNEWQLKKLTAQNFNPLPDNDSSTTKRKTDYPFDMSISPLQEYFYSPLKDTLLGAVLRIENTGNADVVVCLTDETSKRVIRNNYVNAHYFFLMNQIPSGRYSLKIMYGKNWNARNKNPVDTSYSGMFDTVYAYAKINLGKVNNKTVNDAKAFPYKEDKKIEVKDWKLLSPQFHITAKEFFRKK